mmetsp:Transcript_35277/g.55063  ORF Transcript_35277/g.55063 Transcript_35277/m.55063 type:complete len:101 (+) Transcript_35277:277-579(+)
MVWEKISSFQEKEKEMRDLKKMKKELQKHNGGHQKWFLVVEKEKKLIPISQPFLLDLVEVVMMAVIVADRGVVIVAEQGVVMVVLGKVGFVVPTKKMIYL